MDDASRRRMLRQAAALPALAVLPMFFKDGTARAGGNGAKEDFHYQDHPNEGKNCANCAAFIPPEKGAAQGQCKIVAGAISASGWCMAFTQKG